MTCILFSAHNVVSHCELNTVPSRQHVTTFLSSNDPKIVKFYCG